LSFSGRASDVQGAILPVQGINPPGCDMVSLVPAYAKLHPKWVRS